LLTVQGTFYLLDYIYRIVQSLKLILGYWNRSIVKLPIVKLKSTRQFWNEQFNTMRMSMWMWIIRLAPFFYVEFLFVWIVIILIAWFLSGKQQQ